DGFGQRAEPFFTLLQPFFRDSGFGLVPQNFEETHEMWPVFERHHQTAAPEPASVLANMPTFVLGPPFAEGPFHFAFGGAAGAILGYENQPPVPPQNL